ncbi:histidine kinase [Jiulongibacter sp. NS-SX5]|uniref:histidine kinase n=1 Tax=Jiulongibacter sp. NS-SX5 TaxID=3463854 RepID=UPI00405A1D6F
MIKKIVFVLVSLFSFVVKAQELPTCTNCLDSVLTFFWDKNNALDYPLGDTVSTSFEFTSEAVSEGLLFVGTGDIITLNVSKDGELEKTFNLGRSATRNDLPEKYGRFFVPIQFQKGEYLIRLKSASLSNLSYIHHCLYLKGDSYEALENRLHNNARTNTLITWLLVIVSFLFTVLSAVTFFLYKNRFYRSYLVYTFLLFLIASVYLDFFSQNLSAFTYPIIYSYFILAIQQWIYAAYNQFVIEFLDLYHEERKTFYILKTEQAIHLILSLLLPFLLYYTHDYQWMLKKVSIINLANGFLGFWAIIRIIRIIKTPLKYYLVIGTIFFAFSGFAELFLTRIIGAYLARDFYSPTWNGFIGFNIFQIGVMVDMAMFYLALNHKTAQSDKEKLIYEKKVVEQLKENEMLQKELNTYLENEIKLKESELEKSKLLSQKNEVEASLLKSQLKSIQLRMNPHYFFNSLNSINDFIFEKEPRKASEYLAKYASLMRIVLNNSEHLEISVEDELEHLQTYLELEKIRFEERFDYTIETKGGIELNKVKLPTMLLQPILENSIWHGFKNLSHKGIISISMVLEKDFLEVKLSDNGHGFSQNKSGHISMGLKSVREKIDILNKVNSSKIRLSQHSDAGKGVVTEFCFPLKP